ncbi:hypothetical protein HPB48_004388 [Haemaphysalis longicornis]|uniref:Uncharacterized protein n=1 Tax=Haemaphysalis longicornis TaxID=44386 RepID=A0A9J6G266_HAELO|nr:hypothetical protein HPB48_004388 [Haemaphysalis longicornis]
MGQLATGEDVGAERRQVGRGKGERAGHRSSPLLSVSSGALLGLPPHLSALSIPPARKSMKLTWASIPQGQFLRPALFSLLRPPPRLTRALAIGHAFPHRPSPACLHVASSLPAHLFSYFLHLAAALESFALVSFDVTTLLLFLVLGLNIFPSPSFCVPPLSLPLPRPIYSPPSPSRASPIRPSFEQVSNGAAMFDGGLLY